jgi:hypothetical protein
MTTEEIYKAFKYFIESGGLRSEIAAELTKAWVMSHSKEKEDK